MMPSCPTVSRGSARFGGNFLGAMRRWRKDSFDYVYAIEGRHGDKRFHIHLVLRDTDFTLEEVRFLWPGGFVDGEPLLQGRRTVSAGWRATWSKNGMMDG